MRPRVLVLRGHQVNPWELRPWEELADRFDVSYVRTGSGWFDDDLLELPVRRARTMRDLLPRGRVGDALTRLPGDRYLSPTRALEDADIVHSQELGYWYSMQAARLKARLGFKLVLTVWETIPFLDAYRNVRTRRYREHVLKQTDLYLAATERARDALLLEGVRSERIRVSPPGVDLERFGRGAEAPKEHVLVSPGRLVWEKGHQDLLRAVAALRRGVVALPEGVRAPRVLLVGVGKEEKRLLSYARELGIGDLVELRKSVPYDQMPRVFGQASCVLLLSLPQLHWEEQFGMVLAEAMASGAPILASTSGAIPEVAGHQSARIAPGDWRRLAQELATGPLSQPPGTRAEHDLERVARFSAAAAAQRLAAAYEEILGRTPA